MLTRILLLLVCIPSAVFTQNEGSIAAWFDCEVPVNESIEAARVEEFFPPAILRINSKMPEAETEALLETVREKSIAGLNPNEVPPGRNELPLPYFFEAFEIEHTSNGQLERIWFTAHSLPIRRTSIHRLYQLMEDSMGPSDYTYVTGSRARPDPSHLYVEWKRPEGVLVLELGKTTYNDSNASVEFRYFPVQSSLQLVRQRMRTTPIELGDSTSETVSVFLNQFESFQDGEGPFPPIPLGETTEKRLIQYGEIIEWKDLRDFRSNQRLNDLFSRLEPSLSGEFSAFEIPERFEKILNLILTSEDSKVQVGAAAFLASYEDAAVLPFLERGFEFSSFSQVSSHLGRGLAAFCTGQRLQQVTQEFLLGKENADHILRNLSSRQQVGQLWKIRDKTTDAEDQRRLDHLLRRIQQNLN